MSDVSVEYEKALDFLQFHISIYRCGSFLDQENGFYLSIILFGTLLAKAR